MKKKEGSILGTKTKGSKKNKRTVQISASVLLFAIVIMIVSVIYKDSLQKANNESADQQKETVVAPKVKETEEVKIDKEPTTTKEHNNTQEKPTKTEAKPQVKEKPPEQQKVNEAGYIEGQKLSEKPTYVGGVLIANKKHPLPASFAPGVVPEAKTALDTMVAAAKVSGFELTAFSSYRSYDRQQQLYTNYVKKDGKTAADRYSARPGYSEHQTGLAFDIGEVGRKDLWLTEEFGETSAGKWLKNHAHEYGFILRYPKGKESVTGYMYESWHFRYIGIDLAKKVHGKKVTLEEYLNIQ